MYTNQILRVLSFYWAKHEQLTLGQIVEAVVAKADSSVADITDQQFLHALQEIRHDEDVANGTATGPFHGWEGEDPNSTKSGPLEG